MHYFFHRYYSNLSDDPVESNYHNEIWMKADYGDDLIILNWSAGIQRIVLYYCKKEMLDKRMKDAASDRDVIGLLMDRGDDCALRCLSDEGNQSWWMVMLHSWIRR